jgi:hypothetical protein
LDKIHDVHLRSKYYFRKKWFYNPDTSQVVHLSDKFRRWNNLFCNLQDMNQNFL